MGVNKKCNLLVLVFGAVATIAVYNLDPCIPSTGFMTRHAGMLIIGTFVVTLWALFPCGGDRGNKQT